MLIKVIGSELVLFISVVAILEWTNVDGGSCVVIYLFYFAVSAIIIGYIVNGAVKYRTMKKIMKYVIHLQPETMSLTKRYLSFTKEEVFIVSAYSLLNDSNGLCLIKFQESKMIMASRLKIPSTIFGSLCRYTYYGVKLRRMTKKCQIPVDRHHAIKGKALIYFLPDKVLEEEYGEIKSIFQVFKNDTEKENPDLEKESNREILIAGALTIAPGLLVFFIKIIYPVFLKIFF